MDYDDKAYYDTDDAVICLDRKTGEEYIINPAGTRIYVAEA